MSHSPGLTMHPSSVPLGADIVGVDLAADMDEPTFRAIEDAYNTSTVVVIRHQHLTPEHLLHFTRRFGSLERSPLGIKLTRSGYDNRLFMYHRDIPSMCIVPSTYPYRDIPRKLKHQMNRSASKVKGKLTTIFDPEP